MALKLLKFQMALRSECAGRFMSLMNIYFFNDDDYVSTHDTISYEK